MAYTQCLQPFTILDLVPKGGLVTLYNAFSLTLVNTGLISLYMIFTRPYHKAQLRYKELCIAMANCPAIPKAKIADWLLEYYNDTNIYSLHPMGKSYALSDLNSLRCASWLVTCSVILVNLLKHLPDQPEEIDYPLRSRPVIIRCTSI